MRGLLWLSPLFLLLSFSDARTLKLLPTSKIPTNISSIPLTTTTPFSTSTADQSSTNGPTTTVSPPTTASIHTTEHTTESAIQQLVAFTDSSSSNGEQVLEILNNETISLDEFDFSDNSTTVLPTTTVVAPKGMIRQCQCTEVLDCKLESRNETDNCFDHCDEQLGFLGNDTQSYIDCFEKNKDGITHAEECLESALSSSCNPSLTAQFLEARDHEEYLNTKFILNKEPKKTRPLLHKTHHVLAGFHEFFHCTKNCIHKRMRGCLRQKNCSIRLPSVPSFGEIMSSCAKNQVKVSRSLRSTCQCLLHKKKLKQLAGSCAVMTPFRVKNI